MLEQSFQKLTGGAAGAISAHDAQMAQVIAALWAAFPEATSENDLAERAAPYFRNRQGQAIDPKTVRLWLQGVSLPRAEFIFVLIGMVGAGFFGLSLRPAARFGRGAE
jgi:hypothetical protein